MKLKKKGKIVLAIILSIIAIVIIAAGVFFYGIFHRVTNSPKLTNASRNEKWTADLKYLKTELPKKHKNLFFAKSKDEFNKDMNLLISKVNSYNDEEIKGELVKIIVSVKDGHTAVDVNGKSLYPLAFFEFENQIYVRNCSLKYKNLWGKKLTAINGYSIKQIHSKLDPYISKDNKAIMKNQFSVALSSPELLKMAKIIKSDEATYTFEGLSKNNVKIEPLENQKYNTTKFVSDDPQYMNKFPLSRQNADKNYWFKYIKNRKALYVKYNVCFNMSNRSFKEFTKDVFKVLDSEKAAILIIDLRDNGGGNSSVFNPFLKEIKSRSSINKKGSLFAIVGRKTFSSAILNAMDLRNGTNATLVGEPTGGKPNHFGEVKILHLSNVNVDVSYSSRYFETSEDDTDSLYPDVNITLKASSFFKGKDDFLEYILNKK